MAEKKTHYMNMKLEDLKEVMAKYDMDEKTFTSESGQLNRKMVADMLKIIDVQVGKTKDVILQDANGEIKTHVPTTKINGVALSGMMVEIEFFNTDENDLPYVQIALQGIALTIPRERKAWIPKEFVDGCLRHTVTTKLKMDVSRDGKIRYIPKAVPRFQYTVHGIMHIDELKKKAIEGKGQILDN